jgi:hypothetical protein
MRTQSSVRQKKEIITSWDVVLCNCVVSYIDNDVLEKPKPSAPIFTKETMDRIRRITELGD